jgi:hypothetical protein
MLLLVKVAAAACHARNPCMQPMHATHARTSKPTCAAAARPIAGSGARSQPLHQPVNALPTPGCALRPPAHARPVRAPPLCERGRLQQHAALWAGGRAGPCGWGWPIRALQPARLQCWAAAAPWCLRKQRALRNAYSRRRAPYGAAVRPKQWAACWSGVHECCPHRTSAGRPLRQQPFPATLNTSAAVLLLRVRHQGGAVRLLGHR